jgi:hypothetical protein
VNRPLYVEVTDLAAAQILAADDWWRLNLRPRRTQSEKSCNALPFLSRSNLASVHGRGTSRSPAFVDCISTEFITTSTTGWLPTPSRAKSWPSGIRVVGVIHNSDMWRIGDGQRRQLADNR